VGRPRGLDLRLPETWLRERLARDPAEREPQGVDLDDVDVQTLMQALFDIRSDVRTILELLLEDEDGEEEEEMDP
jgi:hypothetical protein